MLPPHPMVATKIQTGISPVILLLLAGLLAGCTPPGPRALLEGRRLLEAGKYQQAVDKLLVATSLLTSNGPAWNHLGLAYHRTGQFSNAAVAYQQAVALDRELLEARYNLGSLWLEQNRLDAAKNELTAYTLRRGNIVEGWLKLGTVQLRLRELAAAERSFREALRINAQHPEAFNGLGLVQAQRNRPREAVQFFSAALKQRPDYGPARLNLATVLHQQLNDVSGALQVYREYLALKPPPAGYTTVSALAQSLEQQLAAAQRPPPPTNAVAQPPVKVAVPVTPPITPTNVTQPGPTVVERVKPPVKVEPSPPVTKPAPDKPTPSPAPVEIVTLPPEPVIKITPTPATEVAVVTPSETQPVEVAPPVKPPLIPVESPQPAKSEKPGFFSRVNPLNLFRRESKAPLEMKVLPPSETIPSADTTSSVTERAQAGVPPSITTTPVPSKPDSPEPPEASSLPRYPYLLPTVPAPGNRREAERAFAQGEQAKRANRLSEAVQAYRQATVVDPAYFEAYYNLGLAAYEARSYRAALGAWETALALQPDSTNARYNFALALKAGNYPVDAAQELEKIVAGNPHEARAHLVLGNLYAEQLGNPSRARTHYLKVLEVDPRNAQATAIRYWLVAHPP